MPVVSKAGPQGPFPGGTFPVSREPKHDMDTSPTAKMDFLHALMAQQGRPCDGMNWRLLVLEWRYDLAVLFGNVRDWMRYVDRQFDRPQD